MSNNNYINYITGVDCQLGRTFCRRCGKVYSLTTLCKSLFMECGKCLNLRRLEIELANQNVQLTEEEPAIVEEEMKETDEITCPYQDTDHNNPKGCPSCFVNSFLQDDECSSIASSHPSPICDEEEEKEDDKDINDINVDREYVVDSILNYDPSSQRWLVKWKGYEESSSTWEPYENLMECDIFKKYLFSMLKST
jgi:hypothetical protein